MELIRISDQKLKIMLTAADMCHFELNADSFGKNAQKTRHTFRLLFEEIKKQTDFDADEHHISVQYFPSREGGCEMFISQLQELPAPRCAKAHTEERALAVRSNPRGSGSFRRHCAYRFDEINHLLSVCRRLRDIGYIGESVAYRDEKGVYFLLITLQSTSPFANPDEWSFILEYGSIENATLLKLYISEHGSTICPSAAVETLAELA